MRSVEDRFWSKVEEAPGNCWQWTGLADRYGYGKFSLSGRKVKAHRFAYESVRAEIPAGLCLDHLCRNRLCVNPWHLEPVTNAENIRRRRPDMDTHCAQGHAWTAETLRYDRKGYRFCRRCATLSAARSQARKRAAERGEAVSAND